MIVIRTTTHVAHLTGAEITAFLLHPSDREYQRWWEGTHLEFHPVKGSGHRIGDIVYMDEFVGRRRLRLAAVLVESIPGKKLTWQLKRFVTLPAWLSLELEDDDRGVTITHCIRAGFEGIGRMLDPLFRVYLSKQFTQAMDDHVRAEFPKLETLLHRGAPWRR
jgi:hypothetical protein